MKSGRHSGRQVEIMRRNTTVIFLDNDGVLNKVSKWKRMYSLNEGVHGKSPTEEDNSSAVGLSAA